MTQPNEWQGTDKEVEDILLRMVAAGDMRMLINEQGERAFMLTPQGKANSEKRKREALEEIERLKREGSA